MTVRDMDASMHASRDDGGPSRSERGDLRDTRACDTRVIHEDDRPAQALGGDFVSLHVGEALAAIRALWPFSGEHAAIAAARLAGGLAGTARRIAATAGVVVSITLIVLAAHAAH